MTPEHAPASPGISSPSDDGHSAPPVHSSESTPTGEWYFSATSGYAKARETAGNPEALRNCLRLIAHTYRGRVNDRREMHINRAKALEAENETLARQIDTINAKDTTDVPDTIAWARLHIHRLNAEIAELMADPRKALGDDATRDWMTLLGAGLFLILLSGYLVVFYTSAGYTAFFKDMQQMLDATRQGANISLLFNSIFDPSAFGKAWATRNFFVLLFPVVFMSIGFVVHGMWQRKKYVLMSAIVGITFIFDCIIAYRIGSMIHQSAVLTTDTTGPYGIREAVRDPSVYAVIFAGFVVYLLWSFVYFLFSEEFKKHTGLAAALRQRRHRVEELEAVIARETARAETLKSQIVTNRDEIALEYRRAEGPLIDLGEVKRRFATFVDGWLRAIVDLFPMEAENLPRTREARLVHDSTLKDCEAILTEGGDPMPDHQAVTA